MPIPKLYFNTKKYFMKLKPLIKNNYKNHVKCIIDVYLLLYNSGSLLVIRESNLWINAVKNQKSIHKQIVIIFRCSNPLPQNPHLQQPL